MNTLLKKQEVNPIIFFDRVVNKLFSKDSKYGYENLTFLLGELDNRLVNCSANKLGLAKT